MDLWWEDKGRTRSNDITKAIMDRKDDPTLDVSTEIDKFIGEDLKGVEDPRAIGKYLQQVMPLKESLNTAYQQHQYALMQENIDNMLQTRINDVIDKGGSPEEIRASLDRDMPTWEAMGRTKKALAQAYAKSFITAAEEGHDTSLLAMAYVPGKDGVRLIDVPGVHDAVAAAIPRVRKLEHDDLLQAGRMEREVTNADLITMLKTDPFNHALDADQLLKHVGDFGVFNSEGEYATFWGRVLDARMAGQEQASMEQQWSNPSADWRMWGGNSDFKKWYEEGNMQLMLGMDRNNPNSVRQTMGLLLSRFERSGIAPEGLKHTISTINYATVNALKDKAPADLLLSYQMYRAVLDSDNPEALDGLTSPDSAAMLNQIDRRLKGKPFNEETFNEAILAVKRSHKPVTKAEAEDMINTPSFGKGVESKVKDEFTGMFKWLKGKEGQNLSRVQTFVKQQAKDLLYQNPDLGLEGALDVAMESAKRRWAHDGQNNFFEVPENFTGNRDTLEKSASLYLSKASQVHGESNYTLHLLGDNKGYELFDVASGQPVETISVDQLMVKALPASYVDPTKPADFRDFAARVKQGASKGGLGGITGELSTEMADRFDDTTALLNSDTLTFKEKMFVRQALRARTNADHDNVQRWVAKSLDMTRRATKFDGKEPLSTEMRSTINPMTPGNVAELAKYYYKDNPEASLVMMGEGFSPAPYKDSNGALTIGFGYNYGNRPVKEVRDTMRKAGIPSQQVNDIMEGKGKLTLEQSVNLFKETSKEYTAIAKRAYGDDYDKLAPNVRAVVFDMAYNAGTPSKFQKTLELFKDGKFAEAAKGLSLKYFDKQKNVHVDNNRRVQLWREMLSGQFPLVLDKHIKKKGK